MSAPVAPDMAPVRSTVTVAVAPDRAFELFTSDIGEWWPLDTHSVGGASSTLDMECGPDGRIVEHLADGGTDLWGRITTWDPPCRLAFTWHPGRDAEQATDVEVRFVAVDSGTRVELEHRGWERRADAASMRPRYESGWVAVLGCFASEFTQ